MSSRNLAVLLALGVLSSETLAKARTSGAAVLVEPFLSDHRQSAMVQFPGGYVAEIHAAAKR